MSAVGVYAKNKLDYRKWNNSLLQKNESMNIN